MPAVGRGAALALAVLLGSSHPLEAQERLRVRTEPGTPVVATEVLIAAGPADEPDGRDGLAHLAARAVVQPIQPALDSLEAHLEISAAKDAVGFRLIAAPDAWPEALRLLMLALFRDPVVADAVAAERRRIEAELLGRRDNPADAAIRASDAAFFGEDHPWGRPTVGSAATVSRLTHAEVDAFLRDRFRPEHAVVAVVGPIGPEAAERQLQQYLLGSPPAAGRPPIAPRKPSRSPVRTDYNSVTTWVTAVFPFAAGADVEALRMLAHLAAEELSFGPTRRSVYDSRAEVVRRSSGGEVRLTVVVPPEEASAWADRIVERVEELPRDPFLAETWEGRLRRYRGERLHELASPEDRAAELARGLLADRSATDPVPDIGELSIARIRAAATSLGEPTLVLLGPDIDDGN